MTGAAVGGGGREGKKSSSDLDGRKRIRVSFALYHEDGDGFLVLCAHRAHYFVSVRLQCRGKEIKNEMYNNNGRDALRGDDDDDCGLSPMKFN